MDLREDFISAMDASKLLGIHRMTLHRWTKKHKIDKNFRCPPYYLIGNHLKFKKSEIENFIKECIVD